MKKMPYGRLVRSLIYIAVYGLMIYFIIAFSFSDHPPPITYGQF